MNEPLEDDIMRTPEERIQFLKNNHFILDPIEREYLTVFQVAIRMGCEDIKQDGWKDLLLAKWNNLRMTINNAIDEEVSKLTDA